MKIKSLAVAMLAAAAMFAAGLVANDTHFSLAQATGTDATVAKQPIPLLARKQAIAAKATGDCTLYGSGCLGVWTTYPHGIDGDPATADVLVVGDSIVNRCRPYLRLRLAAAGLTSVFDYWSSRPTAPAVDRMLSYSRIYAPGTFKAVAMGNGTNDIFDPTVMAAQIARAKVIDSPLLWGSVYAGRPATLTADLRNTGWVNQQVSASGLPVIDWFAFLAAKPARVDVYLDSGKIHPTVLTPAVIGDGTGCDAWASIYATKIVSGAKR